ncbi:hypothetical protein GQ600_8013 [Phytophthora cactorum]|nr:hypothetical protein GQ600_8013 [Phytophthora cactorum]
MAIWAGEEATFLAAHSKLMTPGVFHIEMPTAALTRTGAHGADYGKECCPVRNKELGVCINQGVNSLLVTKVPSVCDRKANYVIVVWTSLVVLVSLGGRGIEATPGTPSHEVFRLDHPSDPVTDHDTAPDRQLRDTSSSHRKDHPLRCDLGVRLVEAVLLLLHDGRELCSEELALVGGPERHLGRIAVAAVAQCKDARILFVVQLKQLIDLDRALLSDK